MRKKGILFFILSAVSLFSLGQDILGSHITYKAIDTSAYIVTLTVFQDCHNKTAPNDSIEIRWDTGVHYFKSRTYKISERDVTGYGTNCAVQSLCSDIGKYGVKELIYIDTIIVTNIPKCTFDIIWIGKRKAASGIAAEDLYCYSTLNKCLISPNNSVSYKTPLQFLKYYNQKVSISIRILEEKDTADTLIISLQCPLKDKGVKISQFVNSTCKSSCFTFGYPSRCSGCPLTGYLGYPNAGLNSPAGCRFNAQSGTYSLRTTIINEFKYYCFEVREWREVNGIQQVIATTRFDMSTLVIDNPNNLPRIGKYGYNDIDVCAGALLEFNINTSDRDNDSITLQWQSNLPNTAIKLIDSNTRTPSLKITWQTDTSHLSKEPYYIYVKANDNKCPFNGVTERTYRVNLSKTPDTLDFYSTKSIKCNTVDLKGYKKTGLKHLYFKWLPYDSSSQIFGNSASFTFAKKGWQKYILQPNTSVCVGQNYIDSIFIPSYTISTDTTVCFKSNLSFSASMLNVYTPLTYSWLGTNITDSIINVLPESDSIFTVKITDANNCEVFDSIKVTTHPKIIVDIGNDTTVCEGSSLTFHTKTKNAKSPIDYFWNLTKGGSSYYDSITKSKSISLAITDANNCTATDKNIVTMIDLPTFSLGNDKRLCMGDSVILKADVVSGQKPYTYKWSGGSTTNQISFQVNQTQKHILKVEEANGCYNHDSIIITALPSPQINFSSSIDSGFIFSEAAFSNQSQKASQWLWNIIDPTGQTVYATNQFVFNYTFNSEGGYSIQLMGKNKECSSTLLKKNLVKIFAKPFLSVGKSDKILFRCYPNPANDYVIIEGRKIKDISLFNTLGESIKIDLNTLSTDYYSISTQNLTKGMYLIKVTFTDTSGAYKKLLIQ